MNKNFRNILQYLFFLGLGIFLVWLSVRSIDAEKWRQIKQSLIHARYQLAIPVFLVLAFSHFVRALRWRLLMESVSHKPGIINTFFAVMVGYLANQAVPRLGEVLKCTVLARYEKMPASKLVGTIILERLIDAVCLLIVFGITLAIQPDLYSELIHSTFGNTGAPKEKKVPIYLLLLALAAILFLAVWVWMIIKKKNWADVMLIFKSTMQKVWHGLSAIQHLKKRGQFIFLTIVLWACYLGAGYIGFFALKETSMYGIREAFSVLSVGSVGMIATPGGIGAYPYLIERIMQLYGLDESIAVAFGWIFWIAQTLVILVLGSLSLALLPILNRKKASPLETENHQQD